MIPHITLKLAMTLDGKIATRSGESKWITGSESRAKVMEIRRSHDAILVGVNTVIADDPSLTVRDAEGMTDPSQSLRRFILDTRGRIPLSARIINGNSDNLTSVLGGAEFSVDVESALESNLVPVMRCAMVDGRVDIVDACRRMCGQGVRSLMVEGGGETAASFLESGLISEVFMFIAPVIVGGRDAPLAVGGRGFCSPDDLNRMSLQNWNVQTCGQDILMHGFLTPDFPVAGNVG